MNPLTPKNEEEIAEIVHEHAREKKPLRILGGGTRQGLGHAVDGRSISTLKLNGITLYEPASLTMVVKAGTPLKTIEKALAKQGQHLPFEPADYRVLLGSRGEPTIGGLVACAISGPRRIQAGALRDSLIGVRFINGEGDIIKSGGRVMKNVTGYDLVKLLAGSYGTLGILSELSFKLLPAPERVANIEIENLDDEKAVEAMSIALGSPFDVSAAAHFKTKKTGTTMIRLEGFKQSVLYRSEQLKQLLDEFGKTKIVADQSKVKSKWSDIRDVTSFGDKRGAVWRLSLKPSDSPAVVAVIREAHELEAIYDWGGGLVWLLMPALKDSGEKAVRQAVNKVGGHATLIRQVAKENVGNIFHPQSSAVQHLSRALRMKFDPHSILNHGRMGV